MSTCNAFLCGLYSCSSLFNGGGALLWFISTDMGHGVVVSVARGRLPARRALFSFRFWFSVLRIYVSSV